MWQTRFRMAFACVCIQNPLFMFTIYILQIGMHLMLIYRSRRRLDSIRFDGFLSNVFIAHRIRFICALCNTHNLKSSCVVFSLALFFPLHFGSVFFFAATTSATAATKNQRIVHEINRSVTYFYLICIFLLIFLLIHSFGTIFFSLICHVAMAS